MGCFTLNFSARTALLGATTCNCAQCSGQHSESVTATDTEEEIVRIFAAAHIINARCESIAIEAREQADAMEVPSRLSRQIKSMLESNPEHSWDQAVAEIAEAESD